MFPVFLELVVRKCVVIIGGGPSGLISSYVFKMCGVDVKLLEPGALGGEFLTGGLRYIHQTTEMERMLDRLGVPYSPYKVNGGILLKGAVVPYPEHLWKLPEVDGARIQADHYRKTRRTIPTDISTAMNDPVKKGPRRALRCDFHELIAAMAHNLEIIPRGLSRILADGLLKLSDGTTLRYDYLITTIPLWVLRGIAPFYVPETVAARLNVVTVKPRFDGYAKWDYVYTPYTPGDVVHRFSPSESGYAVEANGILDRTKLESDLHFIFPDGFTIDTVREGLKGHLLPLDASPEWPENVAPIGRFAKWDSRSTMDVALEDALQTAERWLG